MRLFEEYGEMSNDYESEEQLEIKFIRRLNAIGYKTVNIRDENSLILHFREVLNQRNSKNLNGEALTDSEFKRLINEMLSSRTLYEIA